MTKFSEDSNIPTKKVKVQVTEGFFATFGELSHFSLLGGTSSILRTFLGGTSEKTHPVCFCSGWPFEVTYKNSQWGKI